MDGQGPRVAEPVERCRAAGSQSCEILRPLSRRSQICSSVSAKRLIVSIEFCGFAAVASAGGQSGGGTTQNVQNNNDSVSQLAPSAVHWALAVILAVALVGGLVRVVRVLQKEDSITPIRHAPDGMRAVQCGCCQAMQHVSIHGRIFICFSCHSANRIAMDIATSEEHHLVSATGPFRKFEFRREGENFFQEIHRVEIDDAEAAALIATKVPADSAAIAITVPAPDATPSNELAPASDAATADGPAADQGSSAETQEADNGSGQMMGTRPIPTIVGRPSSDLESNPSITSKTSKKSVLSISGLPTCVVCLEEEGNMVLLPCAHGGVCEGCSTRIAQNRAQGGAHCPHCRSAIETLVKLHEVDGAIARGVEFRIPIARVAA